jgi:hypothetical protein
MGFFPEAFSDWETIAADAPPPPWLALRGSRASHRIKFTFFSMATILGVSMFCQQNSLRGFVHCFDTGQALLNRLCRRCKTPKSSGDKLLK